jgi:hypothetical protein
MLMEDEKLGFPDYEKRAELELKGITLWKRNQMQLGLVWIE